MNGLISTVEDFLGAENERDWDLWAGYLHPYVRYRLVGEQESVRGRHNYVRRMQQAYARIPDWRFRVLHICSDGRAAVAEFDGEGHFTGAHRGQHVERAYLRLLSVCVFEFRDEQIYTVREYPDRAGRERQLDAALE